jgi:membrane protein DedA with SNARE-associated domain
MAAKDFYERHGGIAIVLAVRAAGADIHAVRGRRRAMSYPLFAVYNIAGGIGWVFSMTMAGYLWQCAVHRRKLRSGCDPDCLSPVCCQS